MKRIHSILFSILMLLIILISGCNLQGSTITTPTVSVEAPQLNQPPKLSGKVVYQSSVNGKYQIFLLDLTLGETKQLTNEGENIEPSWSPDGMHIVFGCDKGQKFEICVIDESGAEEIRLTNNTFNDWSPRWSPDGTKLVYVSSEVPFAHLMIMDLETGESKRLLNNEGNEGGPRWSPDGNRIIYMSDRGGYFNIYTIQVDGTGEVQITNFGQDDRPTWSPDGTKLAFRRKVTESSVFSGAEIILADSSGKNELQLTHNMQADDWPTFSPDGKWILYSAEMGTEPQLVVIPVNGGIPSLLVKDNIYGSAPDWKP